MFFTVSDSFKYSCYKTMLADSVCGFAILIAMLSFTPVALAQEKVREEITKKKDTIQKQIPTNKKGIENTIDLASKTLPNTNDPRFQRVIELRRNHKDYLKLLSEGKVRLFPDIVNNWSSYVLELQKLQALNEKWLKTSDVVNKAELKAQIQLGMQPFGFALVDGDYGHKFNKLSSSQLSEQKRLDTLFNVTYTDGSPSVVELLTPTTYYTLVDMPMEVRFRAPLGTEIILSSESGGLFSNDLSKIVIVADANNIARAYWHSYGDAVANCSIVYKSKKYNDVGHITPVVKQLKLQALSDLSPSVKP